MSKKRSLKDYVNTVLKYSKSSPSHVFYGESINEYGGLVLRSVYPPIRVAVGSVELLRVIDDLRDSIMITPIKLSRRGISGLSVWSGIKIEHFPTGIIIKNTSHMTQTENKKAALSSMLEKLCKFRTDYPLPRSTDPVEVKGSFPKADIDTAKAKYECLAEQFLIEAGWVRETHNRWSKKDKYHICSMGAAIEAQYKELGL